MNKKGFTLVEIIASIIILGLISVLTITTIQSSVKTVKEKNYENIKRMIIEATINYINTTDDEEFKLDNIKPEKELCEEKAICAKEYDVGTIIDKNIYYSNTKNGSNVNTVINPITNEGMRNKKFIIYYDIESHSLKGIFNEDIKGDKL